jgi:ethanolamine transporter EutH
MQLIIVLGIIAKLASVYGDCDVGKTIHNFDFTKVSSNMFMCFLYQAVIATGLCY